LLFFFQPYVMKRGCLVLLLSQPPNSPKNTQQLLSAPNQVVKQYICSGKIAVEVRMVKIDYKKMLQHLYSPPANKFTLVDVPTMNFLMVNGHGDPNIAPEFQENTEALYTLAYTIKFALKPAVEFVVPPPEGLWWMEDMSEFSLAAKARWDWTLMMMQPEVVTADIFTSALQQALRKKALPALQKVRLEAYAEGLSVQIMYYSAYADEGPTIARMHAYIRDEGYVTNGKHHEIYLGDPRRTPPEKLKTVIRQPVRKAG
jgi:hypothetical protein